MNPKYLLTAILLVFLSAPSVQAQFLKDLVKKGESVLKGESAISKDDASNGLKEALSIGTDEAVAYLSKEDGYLKSEWQIKIPKEAKTVTSKLKSVPGFQNVEKDLLEKMNRAAELAAKKAGPIFLDAIKEISFNDAMGILGGEDDAATRYLERKSSEKLYTAFIPVIRKSLDEVNLRDFWSNAVGAYNKIPFTKDANPELDDHVTNKALVGMFGLIEVKEEGIRNNADQRSTDLLKKVFGNK